VATRSRDEFGGRVSEADVSACVKAKLVSLFNWPILLYKSISV
jgi:hypothetical protein